MFVKIDNKNMGLLEIDAWIKRTRNANNGVISPEFAMEVLSKTNHFGHIKKVIQTIEKLPVEKQKEYKDFVLAAIDEREQKGEALAGLRRLADVCEVREEFEELNKKLNFYNSKEFVLSYVTVKTKEEFENLQGKFLRVIYDNSLTQENLMLDTELDNCDFTGIKELIFAPGSTASIYGATKMPKFIDASNCLWVRIEESDLERVEELKLGDCVSVVFECCENLPKNLDVSMCSTLEINSCDLRDVKEVKFKDGAEVSLCGSYLPEILDVSNCSEVNMEDCDFIGVKKVKFKNKAQREALRDRVDNFRAKVSYATKSKPNVGGMEL